MMARLIVSAVVELVSCEDYCRRRCDGNPVLPVYRGSTKHMPPEVQALLMVVEAGLLGLPLPLVLTRLMILAARLMLLAREKLGNEPLAKTVSEVICEAYGDEQELCITMLKPRLEALLEIADRLGEAARRGERDKARVIKEEFERELASILEYLAGSRVEVEVGEVKLG